MSVPLFLISRRKSCEKKACLGMIILTAKALPITNNTELGFEFD